MPKPDLLPPWDQLEADVIETLLAGHHEWRPDLGYPESHSDMAGAVRGLLRMYEVKRRPIAIDLPLNCYTCNGKKKVQALETPGDPSRLRTVPCPTCRKET